MRANHSVTLLPWYTNRNANLREKIIFKVGINAEYILTKDNSSSSSWSATDSVLAVEFDDGTAISLKDFDCPAIYRCLEEYDWGPIFRIPRCSRSNCKKDDACNQEV